MKAALVTCMCNHCSGKLEFDAANFDPANPAVIQCPHCALDTTLYIPHVARLEPVMQPPVMPPSLPLERYITQTEPIAIARLETGRKTSMGGLAMELIGFVLLFLFPVGTIFGIAFMIAGFKASKILRCSHCGNRVVDEHVRICPSCQARVNTFR